MQERLKSTEADNELSKRIANFQSKIALDLAKRLKSVDIDIDL